MRWKWASWINIVLGVWLIVAPFALSYSSVGRGTPSGWHVALANDIVVGVLVIVFAGIAVASPARNWAHWVIAGASYVVVALGIWEIIAPFALSYSSRGRAVTNDILVGTGFIVFGLIAALSTRRAAASVEEERMRRAA